MAARAPRILIVEDDSVNALLISQILKGRGYEILHAREGSQGLSMAQKNVPNLIILDIMMPDVSGTDLLAQLKADPALKAVPVLMCTALNDPEVVEKHLAKGAAAFISKPFDSKSVAQKVADLLQNKPPVE